MGVERQECPTRATGQWRNKQTGTGGMNWDTRGLLVLTILM